MAGPVSIGLRILIGTSRPLSKRFKDTPHVSPKVMLRRWRVFFMACAETFAYDHGREWGVVHVRMRK